MEIPRNHNGCVGFFCICLQQHTHPASHKNSALRVGLFYIYSIQHPLPPLSTALRVLHSDLSRLHDDDNVRMRKE